MLWFDIVAVVVFACLVSAREEPFRGHKVIRISAKSDHDIQDFARFLTNQTHLDVWRYPSSIDKSFDVRLSTADYKSMTGWLDVSRYHIAVMIDDLQSLVNREREERERETRGDDFDYSKYHTLTEIYAWLQDMASEFKGNATLFNVTNSYEGRPLMGIKISTPSTTPEKKSAFWIEGGIHAREWISPATVIYMANRMLTSFTKDPAMAKVVELFDWYILPVTNPDGYEYTWKNDKARMWRKTRSKQRGFCIGVDPNRNWDLHWCESGASKDACADDYCGPSAFSEVEVKGVADFVNLIGAKGFIDFHSYSQLWMSPWGYTKKLPDDFKQQDAGSEIAVKAIANAGFGTKYDHGSIANIIYEASGSSADWAYGKANVKYSYGVELRDTGKYGFILPADQIIPSGQETLQGVIKLAQFVYDN